MTKEQIVNLTIDNDLVEEVYGALHSIIMAKFGNLRGRADEPYGKREQRWTKQKEMHITHGTGEKDATN